MSKIIIIRVKSKNQLKLDIIIVVVKIWDEQPTVKIACKLSVYLDYDLGKDLRKRINITGRGETVRNPSSVEMRSRRAS